jgi:hypothetical protein
MTLPLPALSRFRARWRARVWTLGLLSAGLASQSVRADWPDLYDPLRVRTLHLQMEPGSSWGAVVSDSDFNNPQNALLWTDAEAPIAVTVKRKSDPAIGQKVSVKIDINARVPGQTWHGVKKLSLENGAEGGLVKEGFAWQMHRLASEAGFYSYPAAHVAWVQLVVDGQLIGAYTSVEERDKQMLENRGMWKENATWLYKNDPNPTLEAGTGDSPGLDHLCYAPFGSCPQPFNVEADLTTWIDMQGMLTLGAVEAFTGNRDGLFTHDGKNHFFADFAPAPELRRLYFPWDLDTGISDVAKPILGFPGEYSTRILGHPWFRRWYLHIMADLLDGPLSAAALTDFLDHLEPVLMPVLAADPNSSEEGDFQSLREWVTNRVANVRGQIGAVVGPPSLSPPPGEIIPGFQLFLTHTNSSGTIYYTIDGTDPRAIGGSVAGSAYSGPILLARSAHVMARVLMGTNWSALREGTFNVASHAAGMKVTEIMYQPLAPNTNEDAAEYEFIEFQNRSSGTIDLSGCYFTGIDFRFRRGTMVPAGNFILLVRNGVAFTNRYPGTAYHGIFWGGLDKNGEKIRLKNSDANNIISVEYDDDIPWPLGANGFGWSLVNLAPEGDPDLSTNWRASANLHGSPGAADSQPGYPTGIVVNEVLAHTDPPQEDAIELHNPASGPVDVGGWYLSDQIDNNDPTGALLKKFRIPDATIIPARGFTTFYESNFNSGPNPFALSSYGDQVYLSSADGAGALTGGIVGARFGASDNGMSVGRHRTSRGFDFTALEMVSLGASNSLPRLGPVVINEIMYRPGSNGTEFIELHNRGTTNVDLSGWTVEGASFVFPLGTTIGARDFLVLIGTTNQSPIEFRAANNVPVSVPILGHTFDLGNAGENLELKKPNDFPTNAPIRVDRVRYNDKGPWPQEADGRGPSLERVSPDAYGNEPLNWRTTRLGGSPGRPTVTSNIIAIVPGSSWKHNFLSRNLGNPWHMSAYSDSGWHTDQAPLGYGAPLLATVLTNPPGIMTRPITAYFRKEFVVNDDPVSISNLTFSANYDDGFVAWLNGQEVVRRALAAGAVNAFTLAVDHSAGAYETIDLTAQKLVLRRGLNILAVEVHQSTANDPDLFWDADLTYRVGENPEPVPVLIVEFGFESPGFLLRWDSVPGETYRVQHSHDLVVWTDTSSSITASGPVAEFIDAASSTARFYRVISE